MHLHDHPGVCGGRDWQIICRGRRWGCRGSPEDSVFPGNTRPCTGWSRTTAPGAACRHLLLFPCRCPASVRRGHPWTRTSLGIAPHLTLPPAFLQSSTNSRRPGAEILVKATTDGCVTGLLQGAVRPQRQRAAGYAHESGMRPGASCPADCQARVQVPRLFTPDSTRSRDLSGGRHSRRLPVLRG